VYSVRAQQSVAGGRTAEYEARISKFFDLLRQQQGFQGGALLNSLSYPFQYQLIANFENRQASASFSRSQAFQNWFQQNPNDNLYTVLAPVEAYEVVTYQRQGGNAKAAHLAFRTIDPAKAQAFQQSREDLFKIVQQSRGAVTCALSRLAGSQNRWAAYLSFLTEEDMQAAANAQQTQAWIARHLTAYDDGPADAESYEVVLAHVLATAQA
jgi:antibiotic biosynthesis monooxygenase (ABM) superfamily enzyme